MKDRSNQRIFDQYLSARNDFKRGQYKLSTKKLAPLNLITDNVDVNHLLVMSLYRQKDYLGAQRVLLQDINSYTTSTKLTKLMIQILLKNNEYIMCYEIITSFKDVNLKHQLLMLVKTHEADSDHRDSAEITKIAKDFYHLSNFTLIKQRIMLKRAQRLPLKKFVQIAKALLIDPFLAPIMRLSVLDILRKINVKAKLTYRWIDNHLYKIDPSKLLDLVETASYKQIMRIVQSSYFHDPTRMIALEQVLRLGLSYLYPFNDTVIKDPHLWVKIADLRLQGKQPEFLNDQIKSVYDLQVKLNHFTKNLIK